MFRFAVGFLMLALGSALFGFGLAGDFTYDAAKVLFFVFLVLSVVSFIADAFDVRSIDPV